MAMRREQVAAALRYLQDKADLRGRLQRATSLDPQEQDLADIAVETGASLVPGVGPALAARDFERARRADDPVGMGMAAASAVPGGKLAGLLKRYDPTRLELDVYHGTPHRFPATEANPLGEFDARKIGTGEGAQAYGHGIYLAESPGVAKDYQKSFQQNIDQSYQTVTNKRLDALLDEFGGDAEKAVNRFMQSVYDTPKAKERMRQQLLEELGEGKKKASLYKADLPDEMIDRMLDWDKPLSEQPAAVREAIETRVRHSNSSRKFLSTNPTGEQLYDMFSDRGDHRNPIEAAAAFKEAGIPGIKFLDAGSRGQGGSGTRNFVVFPGEEKKVRILERDGQKAPPQKIAQALEAAPRKPEMAFDAPEVKPGDIVDGLKVRPEVANVGSIKASLDNYTVLPGIRSVSIADFGEAGPLTGNVEKLDRRTRNLADQITESKEITPLIVVYSGSQNYILEGSHRIDALDALGKKRIPVIAVIDEDDPPKFMRQKR